MSDPDLNPAAARLIAGFAPEERTISRLLLRMAAERNGKPLLGIGGEEYAAGDIAARAGRTAALLAAHGVARGDRVAILCGNRIEFFDFLFGCVWLGAQAVPINTAARGEQLRHILANSGARLMVIEAVAVEVMAYVQRTGTGLEAIWVLPGEGWAADDAVGDWTPGPVPAHGASREAEAVAPGDTAVIIYTSGTTGPSKGVCCPQAQFFWWGVNSIDVLEIEPGDVLLTTLPLFHVNAMGAFFQALLGGAKLVVLERFSASGFSGSLVQHGATVTYLLGAMVSMLMSASDSPDDRAHRVRRALAPGVPAQFHDGFTARFGMTLVDGYGSTESNFVIGDVAAEQVPGSMGRLRPGFEARVADESDNPVPDGQPGELLLRARHPFAFASGYHAMAEQTAATWRNLWFHTGDRVYREPDGRFYFMDRIKDAIRRRGENISAYEVEQVLLSHPAIVIAAVYPVPSVLGEDEVMASIVLQPGATLPPEALMDFCQPRMTYFSIPRFVRFVEAVPTTENGKIQKYKLRETGVTADTWDREASGYVLVRQRRAGAR